ncbi:hypothetical protein AB433_08705 [Croceicoccus naphthovorans]|uniref:HTH cro/C1-type domain-containing protein n=1 Tax=Croceicoccus naphthovorans TaxID=1348774 RepID=A0A0G3XI81_9SPHN|nr:hypothetical protein AB433_08705 [Croceicoccus naphthovorans]
MPPRGHPLVRALFKSMREKSVTYKQLSAASGVKISTFKAWRHHNSITPRSIQAALSAVDLRALPVPFLETLPSPLAEKLREIGDKHGIEPPISQLVMLAADAPKMRAGQC